MPGLALIHPAFPAQTKTEAIKSQNRSENHENCTERKYLWPASSPEKGLYSTTVSPQQKRPDTFWHPAFPFNVTNKISN
jgi:hypothetical protein